MWWIYRDRTTILILQMLNFMQKVGGINWQVFYGMSDRRRQLRLVCQGEGADWLRRLRKEKEKRKTNNTGHLIDQHFNNGWNWTLTCAWMKRVSISPRSQSNASDERWSSSITRFEQSIDRTRMFIRRVALILACRLKRSSPFTIMNFLLSSRTPVRHKMVKHMINYKTLLWVKQNKRQHTHMHTQDQQSSINWIGAALYKRSLWIFQLTQWFHYVCIEPYLPFNLFLLHYTFVEWLNSLQIIIK